MSKGLRKVIAASLLVIASISAQAGLIIDQGEITGYEGLNIDGTLYDIDFTKKGRCDFIYNGCDSVDDFLFNSMAQAVKANEALLEFVLIDANLNVDSDPENLFGCSDVKKCLVWTAFAFNDSGTFSRQVVRGLNANEFGNDVANNFVATLWKNTELDSVNNATWAYWSIADTSTDVPEPTSLALFTLALVGFGLSRQKKSIN